jgi:hypothetical protein
MTDIYIEISKLTDKFRIMAFGLTQDENKIHEAVQELMLYFLNMNEKTLKDIYDKDGIDGVTRYEKYYTHIDSSCYNSSLTYSNDTMAYSFDNDKNIYNMPNEEVDHFKLNLLEDIDKELDKMYWYDRELFKLYYYEGNTLDSLQAKTRISRNSLFTTIDKVRDILKKELNE